MMTTSKNLSNLVKLLAICSTIELSGAILTDNQVKDDVQKSAAANSTTFYYEADTYLLNKDKDADGQAKSSSVRPASLAMTSGRNGRMMDLDALVGDFAKSRANKERSQTGDRQSRYLSSSSLDVGHGKKLQIQGFIPIVGVKDVTEDSNDSGDEHDQAEQLRNKQRLAQSQANELPYAQSSVGHATFNVHRYLNSEQQPTQDTNPQGQQTEAKYSNGASMADTIKRPLKKLTNFVAGQEGQSPQQQGCLCVPFYMCKNGYISESSLGKTQIQQMIMQQQMSQSKQASDSQLAVEMKSGQLSPQRQQQQLQVEQVSPQAQYADSYVPVDERSFDRELVTMASLINENQPTNQTDRPATSNGDLSQLDQLQQLSALAGEEATNSSSADASPDYSQEILGRMLGLKSASAKSSGQPATGVCGLLRTCCQIPTHLYPSQQDLANERLMAQYTSQVASGPQRHWPRPMHSQAEVTQPQQQTAASAALQRYQAAQSMASSHQQHAQRLPYGFPASRAQQTMAMQPLNTFNPMIENSLAHRSTQFQATNRYPQSGPQVSQYTRATPQAQQMQLFQQHISPTSQLQQQQAKQALPVPLTSVSLAQVASMNQGYTQAGTRQAQAVNNNNIVGTRKILDGRCGLRQAAGITGRVQNLQYHESSADFGEYPAQAAILKRLPGSDSLFVCGGTLISQYWVATAAHCIKKHAQNDLKIRLGEWDVHRDDEFYPFVEKEVRDLIVHPEFVAGNLINDIALLRLDSPVDPTLPHVNPACLPTIDESFNKQRCWVTGWGKDSFGQKGSFQAVLREVELPVVGHNECEQALKQTRLGQHYRLNAGFICAGGEGGRDACEGDGGSGLYCAQDGVIKVAGLVSWGIGCGQAGVPGVYVSMAHYRPWIENIISIDEDIYSPISNMMGSNLISERNANNDTSDALLGTNSSSVTTETPTTTTTATVDSPL